MVMVGLVGLQGMRDGDTALDTMYTDRVVPLRDLKIIADMYAVNITESVNKARNGILTYADAIRNIDIADETIARKWQGFLATRLVDEEKVLVVQLEPLKAAADRTAALVREILAAGQTDRLAEFAATSLYTAIDPVSEKFKALIEIQLKVAKEIYDENQ